MLFLNCCVQFKISCDVLDVLRVLLLHLTLCEPATFSRRFLSLEIELKTSGQVGEFRITEFVNLL